MKIPFSNYKGGVKQIETNFKLPMMKELFETTFSQFSDLHFINEKLKKENITSIVTAAGTQFNFGVRNRRFAGGNNLPSGRYFTICSENDFNDFGALRDEMFAYYNGDSGISPMIFDPLVDTWLSNYLISQGFISEEDSKYPYYLFIYEFAKETDKNKNLESEFVEKIIGSKAFVTYGIRETILDIDKVIDLRLPETQDWFLKTFVALELENESIASKKTGMYFLPKKQISSFEELLPSIISLETGGGDIFGQAIGTWLRCNGANGLIFPSARSTCENNIEDGVITSCKGWILVLYKDAPLPEENNLFGNKVTWSDPDHNHIKVKYISGGNKKGSMSIRGAKEWNLLNFDIEKQIAFGKLEVSPISELIGSKNFQISRMVNRILDSQSGANALWFQDFNTADFIQWHEEQWKGNT
jgi:hypothetical protein